jgi:anthranilate/para-aminobenzoate synthase component II
MYLMIDNYDSFVYNLKAYFEELGREIVVKRSDQITVDEIEKMQPQGIILSPGPKRCRSLCTDSGTSAGKNSDPWSLSRTPDTWTLLWCDGRKR